MRCRGVAKRVRAPRAATVVTATVPCTPRRTWRASPTGASRPVCPGGKRWFQTRKPFGVCGAGADVCLAPNRLGGGGPAHLAESPPVRGAPGGPACLPDGLSQAQRCAPQLGRLESVQGLFTGTAQVLEGVILPPGALTRGQVPRAPQAGQFARVTPVGFAPSAGLLGTQRGGHHPAAMAFWGQRAVEPVPAGSRFRDKAQRWAVSWPLPAAVVDSTLARADGAAGDHRSVVLWSRACETVAGLPSAFGCLLGQHVALAARKLTPG
jgi:hypothetical protein